MDSIEECGHVLWVLFPYESTAQVGDKAAGAHTVHDIGSLLLELRMRPGLKESRGQIALERRRLDSLRMGSMGEIIPSQSPVDAAIQSQHVVPGILEVGEGVHGIAGENEEGDGGITPLHLPRNLVQLRLSEPLEVRFRDVSAHCLEHLEESRSSLDLLAQVLYNDVGEAAEETLALCRLRRQPLRPALSVLSLPVPNHVEEERPRRSGEANEGNFVPLFRNPVLDSLNRLHDVCQFLLRSSWDHPLLPFFAIPCVTVELLPS